MDIQAAFPESKGFSTTNLWYMKQWYLFYAGAAEMLAQAAQTIKLQQLGGEIQSAAALVDTKLHQAGGEMTLP